MSKLFIDIINYHLFFLISCRGDGDHSNFEDSEYDDEIAAAYELFLKDSEQKSHRR